MRLSAYTIIEGIVAMVILSILLTAIVLISFNVYRTFPSARSLMLQNQVRFTLDSMTDIRYNDLRIWSQSGIDYNYTANRFDQFDHVYRATLTGMDSVGESNTQYAVFYIVADED